MTPRERQQTMQLTRPALRILTLCLLGSSLGACAAFDRLGRIGQQPELSAITNPTAQAGYKPVSLPMPPPSIISTTNNSLWRQGSRAFFKDQRAAQIGDLLTVRVRIADNANISNATERKRSGTENLGTSNLFGFENRLVKLLPQGATATSLVNTNSDSDSKGSGTVTRSEALTTDIAAIVTQVLPNGNLVIEGKQEVRVNFEIRELIVAGVVRPEDIEAGNQIDSTKIAQARIAYGGRGQITEVQQPRYGQQALDILLPF